MQFHKGITSHNPPHSYGDCWRTALGCLLDLRPEQVPHFVEMYIDKSTEAMTEHIQNWLGLRGYHLLVMGFADPGSVEEACNFGDGKVLYMLGGTSRNKTNHVVICHHGGIFWDPSPANTGIVGPLDDGTYQISILVPISQVLP